MKRLMLITTAVLVLVAGCSKPASKASNYVPGGEAAPVAAADSVNKGLDIGDVETSIDCELTVAAPTGHGITVDEVRNYKKQLSTVTANISGAAPAALPVTCTIKSSIDFPETPVVIRGRLLREVVQGEREEVGSFSLVTGRDAHALPEGGGSVSPAIWTFNAIEGLDTLPETMLLMVETTLMQAAPGTDEASLNADTAEVTAEYQTVEMSNPLRVNVAPAAPAGE